MKPYGRKYHGHKNTSHGDGCIICFNLSRFRSGEERFRITLHKKVRKAQKRAARRNGKVSF